MGIVGFGGLCPSLGPQGRAVQCVGGRQVGTGTAHPKILPWHPLATSFTPQRVCSCIFLLLDLRGKTECLEREVSRASGRKWEDGGEIRTVICVFIKYLPDGNP